MQAIRIEIQYSKKLQEITGVESESAIVSEGATFAYLLHNIFLSHPDIQSTYPPGTLGLELNGTLPKMHSPLFEGDIVKLSV